MKTESKSRDMRLDAIRGCFLILMAAVHVPTPVSHALQDPLGFNGAAEGFIFLSACLAGLVYGKTYLQKNWTAMSRRMWRRTQLIYIVHLTVLLPVAIISWIFAKSVPPFANQFHDFLVHPWGALALMPLLFHQPPLFDILPLYIIFLGVTPFIMALARRCGWGIILFISALGWLAVQCHLDGHIFGDPARWLPMRLGSFDLLAWQFLWLGGVAIGETSLRKPIIKSKFRAAFGAAALFLILVGFLTRHQFWPQSWWTPELYLWMDKWTLGPLRLLNFAAWVVFFLAWNPHPQKWILSPTALLGRHSLVVFAFHLPVVIAATALIQMLALSNATQTVIALAVIAILFPWAAWLDRRNQRATKMAAALKTSFPPAQAAG